MSPMDDRDAKRRLLDEVIETKVEGIRTGKSYAQYEPEGDGPITHEQALEGIDKIRNSIVGLQNVNWSEHIYPLVALLDRAGFEGLHYPENKQNFGTLLETHDEAVELLKTSPCMKANSEWSLQVKVFLKRCGEVEQ